MLTRTTRFVITAQFASAMFAQAPASPPMDRVLHFTQAETNRELQEIATNIRSITEIPHEDGADVTRFFFGRKFPTRAEAIAVCISEGRRNIDRSVKDLSEDLKATWDEKQTLRPALQGPIDPLIGEGVLRYAKDKRSRTLDDLDGEPE